MADWAIECEGLTKDYSEKRAVWDLSLRVPAGSVYGLLGRNGCGKTTTIKLLLGMLHPTRGSCRVLGSPSDRMPEEIRRRVGYLAEDHPLYPLWRVRWLEQFCRAFYPRWDRALFRDTLDRFGVDPNQRVGKLSRGQRGLVALTLVLSGNPEVLILDDPSMGLDPVVRRQFLEAMVDLIQKEGRTVFLASHQLVDVERLADRIGIMEDGVLRVDCRTEEFVDSVRKVEIRVQDEMSRLERMPGFLGKEPRGNLLTAVFADLDDEKRKRLKELSPGHYEEIPLNLEEAFVAYAGRHVPKEFSRATAFAKGD